MIQLLMDHADISSTAIYTKMRDARTAGAVMRLSSFPSSRGKDRAAGITGRDSVPLDNEGSEVPRNHAE